MKLIVRLVVCAALAVVAVPAVAQVAPPVSSPAVATLPALSVTPDVLGPDGLVTLRLNAGAMGNARLRIGLFERNRPVRVADVQRDFVLQNGVLQTTLNVRADPGTYELRILTNDKTRALASQGAPLLVPGIDSEAGWRLFNGSPFVSSAADAPSNLPLFLPGIKRDRSKKPRVNQNFFAPSGAPLGWKTLPLPILQSVPAFDAGALIVQMTQPNFDFNALRAQISSQLQNAQTRGERGFAGFELTLSHKGLLSVNAPAAIRSLKQIINALAPDAALILSVRGSVSPADVLQIGGECDAIVVPEGEHDTDELLLKAARRAAEEEPLYDLPIFIAPVLSSTFSGVIFPEDGSSGPQSLLFLMAGATGSLNFRGDKADWRPAIERNLPLFVGSVTLEDVGVLPAEEDAAQHFYELLRQANRIPLMARARDNDNKDRAPESFLVRVDENTSAATLQSLKDTANAGAIIYIEGSVPANSSLASQMATLGGGTISSIGTQQSILSLDDAWIFGTIRGQKLRVQQSAQIKLNQNTVVKKSEKGSDELTSPRVVATLEDGTPGVILNPVGKGEVIWMPHQFQSGQDDLASYYAAIAGSLQPALVRLSSPDALQNGQTFNPSNLRVAVRRSAKGALLVALMNDSGTANTLQIAVDGAPKTCLDLGLERELSVATRGFEGRTTVTVPAGGWTLLAFAETRLALDDERNAPRLKAKLQ